jgi:hypothetical protein
VPTSSLLHYPVTIVWMCVCLEGGSGQDLRTHTHICTHMHTHAHTHTHTHSHTRTHTHIHTRTHTHTLHRPPADWLCYFGTVTHDLLHESSSSSSRGVSVNDDGNSSSSGASVNDDGNSSSSSSSMDPQQIAVLAWALARLQVTRGIKLHCV